MNPTGQLVTRSRDDTDKERPQHDNKREQKRIENTALESNPKGSRRSHQYLPCLYVTDDPARFQLHLPSPSFPLRWKILGLQFSLLLL